MKHKRSMILLLGLLCALISACARDDRKTQYTPSDERVKNETQASRTTESSSPEETLKKIRMTYPEVFCSVKELHGDGESLFAVELDVDAADCLAAKEALERELGSQVKINWVSSKLLTDWTTTDQKQQQRDYYFTYQMEGIGKILKLGNIEKARTACEEQDKEAIDEEIERYMQNHPVIRKSDKRVVEADDLMRISYTLSKGQIVYDQVKEVTVRCGRVNFDRLIEESVEGKTVGESYTIPYPIEDRYADVTKDDSEGICEIRILYIYTTEEAVLSDDYVKEYTEYDTVEAWKKALEEGYRGIKRAEAWQKAVGKLKQDSEFGINNEKLVSRSAEFAFEVGFRAEQLGISTEEYIRVIAGEETEDYILWVYEQCENEIKEILLVNAIAEAKNIDVAEAEMKEQCKLDGISYESLSKVEKAKLAYLLLLEKVTEYMTSGTQTP